MVCIFGSDNELTIFLVCLYIGLLGVGIDVSTIYKVSLCPIAELEITI